VRIAVTDQGSAGDGDRRAARAIIDRDATMPGRGAYLCRGRGEAVPDVECLQRASRRGGIARALRAPATAADKLVESVSS
jgi:predicted RNA-binding protein YlxR (DUF448 family)